MVRKASWQKRLDRRANSGLMLDWLNGAAVQGRADEAERDEYRKFYTGCDTCGSIG